MCLYFILRNSTWFWLSKYGEIVQNMGHTNAISSRILASHNDSETLKHANLVVDFPCDQNLGEWTVHNLWSALIGLSIPIAIRTSALGFERLVIRGHPDNGQGMEGNFYLWWWSQDLWNPCGSSFLTNVQNPSRMCSMPWISWNWLLRIAIRLCLVLSQSPPGRIGNCTSKSKLALS